MLASENIVLTHCLLNGYTRFASYGSTLNTNSSILTIYGRTLITYNSILTTYYSTYVFPLFQIHPNNIVQFKTLTVCSHRLAK